jgi:hypothetical protein
VHVPGIVLPKPDRDADVVASSFPERAELRRRLPWLVAAFIVVAVVSLSGLAGCHGRPANDDEQGQVAVAMHSLGAFRADSYGGSGRDCRPGS